VFSEGGESLVWALCGQPHFVGGAASFIDVGEGAGTSRSEVDDSDLVNEGATRFVAVGEMIVGGGGFEVELECFKDDGPACFPKEGFPKEGSGFNIVAESSSTDPNVTESRKKKTRGQISVVVGIVAKLGSNAVLSTRKRRRSRSTWGPAHRVDPE